MKETVDHFLNRVYVLFPSDIVWVYPHKNRVGDADKWTVNQAKQYIKYLEQQEEEVII